MRIAVASSGLGHIARGIETWARDTAEALHRKGVDVTLFAGGELQGDKGTESTRGQRDGGSEGQRDKGDRGTGGQGRRHVMGMDGEVGDGVGHSVPYTVIPCWQRGRWMARVAARVTPGFAWRWGLKSAYGWEQFTFWLHLHKRLVDGRFDILHVQDPMLAFWCRRARLAGRIATTEILAHGTEEPADVLAQFEYVQHLAPWHLEQSLQPLQPAQALLAGQAEQDQGSRDAEHPTPHTRHAPRDAGLQTSALRPPTSDLKPLDLRLASIGNG